MGRTRLLIIFYDNDVNKMIMKNEIKIKKITVGLVISQLSFGGAERQLYELAVGLIKNRDYNPLVICYSSYRQPNGLMLEKKGVHVIYLDIKLNYLSKLAWIKKQLLENNCQIAYAFLNPTNIYCWLACLGTNIRFIASVRGLPKLNLPLYLGLRAALAGSVRIIANSESGKQWAIDNYKVDPKKTVTIANSVRPINFGPRVNVSLRKELGIPNDDIVIGLVSNMKAQKCPELMLEIANELLKKDKNIHFIWIGDGPLLSKILAKYNMFPEKIKRLIHFIGSKNNPEDWYSVFNIFMLTSKWEGLSNSLMEAMSIGLPCVCSKVPGIVDSIQNYQTGILVPNNKTEWVKALHSLVRNPELANSIGQNARQEMLNYSSLKLVNKTSGVFEQVLTQTGMR
jgi:glycosyltransferase involved in cell wall biosynthesis